MKIVSFNVNSVRMRLHQLDALKSELHPAIVGLQETKVQDHEFPVKDLEKLGYQSVFMGQKTHYGVALMFDPDQVTLTDCQYGWDHDTEEAQKRMIIGTFTTPGGETLKVLNGYFPQGENRSHPTKFPAKEKFYQDLMDYLNTQCSPDENLIVMGDFNISPEDRDIGIGEPNRKRWLRDGKTSFLPEEREWWQTLIGWGLKDSFRQIHPDEDRTFSWFDYRSRGFQAEPKRGLRIDTLLATPGLVKKAIDSGVCYDIRGMEKPSDHAPVWTDFALN
ncbi:exodeoxyribonuclease III [Thiomicrospira sp. WB1]|uniref:exodeoxyribonuclease III n=1 Tax=Thiomicrospira sp. WB1 TaxID=1685380 RepID=UPI0007494E22|nr:exodeoxyribonuclease III [Thiomicrospira sp. WB1]KUJ72547.1 exodeoxyribonuclease III [Thiomicrospira sp. WB1]